MIITTAFADVDRIILLVMENKYIAAFLTLIPDLQCATIMDVLFAVYRWLCSPALIMS